MWTRRADRQLRQQIVPLLLGDLSALPAFVAAAPPRLRVAIDGILLDHLHCCEDPVSPALLASLRQGPTVSRARAELTRRHGEARVDAAQLLGQVRDTVSFPTLVSHLDDADPALRTACARALGRLGDVVATRHLLAAVDDPERQLDPFVAAEALVTLGPAVLTRLHRHRAKLGSAALLVALDASCRLADPDAAALLNEMLLRPLPVSLLCDVLVSGAGVANPESHLLAPLATGHPNAQVRRLACRILTRCPDAVARAAIRWASTHPHATTDTTAVSAVTVVEGAVDNGG